MQSEAPPLPVRVCMSSPLPDDVLAERIGECLTGLLAERGAGRTVCPTEVAQLLALRFGCRWQDLMRPVRTVASAMAEQGVLEALQHETVVDIREVRGPVRLRRRVAHGASD